jgi:hypothetical protein
MRLSLDAQIELMAWADGEVPDDVRDRVAQLLEGSDDARQFVEGLRTSHVGEWTREGVLTRLAAVPPITDSVMTRIEMNPTAMSTLPSLRRRAHRQRVRAFAISITTGLAVAAGLTLYFRSDLGRSVVLSPVGQQVASSAPSVELATEPGAKPVAGVARGVEVNDIDAVSHAISVFEIPLGAAAANAAKSTRPSSVVIWIDEDRDRNPR